MRSKNNKAMKLACILGSFAFLMAIVAYAVIFSLGNHYNPAGGSGPPITATFEWNWTVNSTSSYSISATADPDDCRLKKHVSGWFDSTVYSINPAPINQSILSNDKWVGDHSVSSSSVMVSGNKYYWHWDSWEVRADGSSGSKSGGKGSHYNCH